VQQFYEHYGCLPPRAIVDEKGKPLLSWRVLLLPYLGQTRLFHLFHLDEPWDSEYNAKLIPYMPLDYAPSQPGLPLGRTTIKALAGSSTPFPDDRLGYYHDLKEESANVLLCVEVDKAGAVGWTKPEDLVAADGTDWRSQLHKKRVEGQECFHGLLGDGEFYTLPVGVSTGH